MDRGALVEGNEQGLVKIAEAFRKRGLNISGVYLIKLGAEEFDEWVIRLVSPDMRPDQARQMIYELVRLRRDNLLPSVAPNVRFDLVSPNHVEASRVLEYTRKLGGPPVVIQDVMWKGLFIEYAMVAEVPHSTFAPT